MLPLCPLGSSGCGFTNSWSRGVHFTTRIEHGEYAVRSMWKHLESACKQLLHVTGSCVRLFIIQNRYILTTRNELIWGRWQALSENRVRYNRPLQNWSSALKLLHCPRETMSPSQPKSPAPIALLPEDRAVAFGNPIDSGGSRGPSYHRWVLLE